MERLEVETAVEEVLCDKRILDSKCFVDEVKLENMLRRTEEPEIVDPFALEVAAEERVPRNDRVLDLVKRFVDKARVRDPLLWVEELEIMKPLGLEVVDV